MADPIPPREFTVLPEWVDYNGHMNMGYYAVALDFEATDPLYDWLGLGPSYIAEHNMSVFTVTSVMHHLAELFEGQTATVDTLMLGADSRRLHYVHRLQGPDGALAAVNELVAINVDMEERRSAAMPEDVVARIQGVVAAHADLPRPAQLRRRIGL